jgi:hypothetical protein
MLATAGTSGMQTLQNLYRTGFVPPPSPVMSWQPVNDNFVQYSNTTSFIGKPKIGLPPFNNLDIPEHPPKPKKPYFNKYDNQLADSDDGTDQQESIRGDDGSENNRNSGRSRNNRRMDGKNGENKRHGKGGSYSSGVGSKLKKKMKKLAKGMSSKKEDRKGESIWLESSSTFPGHGHGHGKKKSTGYGSSSLGGSSSSSGDGYWGKPDGKGGCYCSIGRSEKGDDAALITLGSIGIPLAIIGSVLGGALGSGAITALLNTTLGNIFGVSYTYF